MNKILLITPFFYPHKGGSQQYAEELHYHLMKQNPKVQVDVLCYNTDNVLPFEHYRGFNVYRIPAWNILPGQFALPNYIYLFKTLRTLFKKNKYVAINSHTRFFDNSWWVPFVARWYNTKSILTDHCANHPVHPSPIVTAVSKAVDTILVPLISRIYDAVTVTNSATYDFLKSLRVIRPIIVYGGVDTDYFKPTPSQKTRTIEGITKTFSENEIIVSFVGRMIESKGPQLLVQVAQTITRKYPHVSFVFAGDGQKYPELSKKASTHIHFLGSQEKSQIRKLLQQTDILVHPSLHHEGFPNVLLEAGASGCAVIATNKGGTYEIIQHQETGILTHATVPAIMKSVEKLIGDSTLRTSLAKALRKSIVQKYSWKKITHEYLFVINHLLTKKSMIPSMRTASVPANK